MLWLAIAEVQVEEPKTAQDSGEALARVAAHLLEARMA
jgi:hypothetical protein